MYRRTTGLARENVWLGWWLCIWRAFGGKGKKAARRICNHVRTTADATNGFSAFSPVLFALQDLPCTHCMSQKLHNPRSVDRKRSVIAWKHSLSCLLAHCATCCAFVGRTAALRAHSRPCLIGDESRLAVVVRLDCRRRGMKCVSLNEIIAFLESNTTCDVRLARLARLLGVYVFQQKGSRGSTALLLTR